MIRIQQIFILSMIIFISSGSYACNSTQPPKDPELVKQINEMLDKMSVNPCEFDPKTLVEGGEDPQVNIDAFAKSYHFFIENSDIALPMMLDRLRDKKLDLISILGVYVIVFEKVKKSAELIPYLADYIASVNEDESKYPDKDGWYRPQAAFSAVYRITSLNFKYLFDEKRPFFDQRKEIADKLRQWYEEYKKANAKQKK